MTKELVSSHWEQEIFLFLKHPNHLWGPPASCWVSSKCSIPGVKWTGQTLTTYHHLLSRLRMCGAIPLHLLMRQWCGAYLSKPIMDGWFLWYCQLVLSGSIEWKKADLEWLKRKWLWSVSRYYACNLLGVLSKIIHVNPRKVSVVAKFQCMHLPNWSLLHHHFSHIVQ